MIGRERELEDVAEALAGGTANGPALLELVDELEDIGAVLYASEAVAHDGEIFLEAGRQDSARRAAVRSQELFPSDQGGQPPAINGWIPARSS